MASARQIAFATLHNVEHGAYASETLRSAAANLDPREAALAEQIVMGVLRFRAQLDFLILHYSGRTPELFARLDPEVRIALRMGIYQLRYLDRIPPHAAVAESVEAVKRARKRSAAGFVNAVLRKVNREPVAWPDRAVELSLPAWMLERWDRQYGVETASDIARAALAQPEKFIRVPPAATPPAGAEPCPEIAGCYLAGSAPVTFRRQDISSQAIVPLLDLQPGQTFLDLCAAPGNKTAQALESGVRAIACDVNLNRLAMLERLPVRRVAADGAAPLPFPRIFDRILVDAPCSGTGTLARNPEIKWRLRHDDIAELQQRQRRLVARALEVLQPGGRLIYSTCSLEQEENDEVAAHFGMRTLLRRLPGRDRGDGFFAAMLQ